MRGGLLVVAVLLLAGRGRAQLTLLRFAPNIYDAFQNFTSQPDWAKTVMKYVPVPEEVINKEKAAQAATHVVDDPLSYYKGGKRHEEWAPQSDEEMKKHNQELRDTPLDLRKNIVQRHEEAAGQERSRENQLNYTGVNQKPVDFFDVLKELQNYAKEANSSVRDTFMTRLADYRDTMSAQAKEEVGDWEWSDLYDVAANSANSMIAEHNGEEAESTGAGRKFSPEALREAQRKSIASTSITDFKDYKQKREEIANIVDAGRAARRVPRRHP